MHCYMVCDNHHVITSYYVMGICYILSNYYTMWHYYIMHCNKASIDIFTMRVSDYVGSLSLTVACLNLPPRCQT